MEVRLRINGDHDLVTGLLAIPWNSATDPLSACMEILTGGRCPFSSIKTLLSGLIKRGHGRDRYRLSGQFCPGFVWGEYSIHPWIGIDRHWV